MKLLIAGDLVPTESNILLFKNKNFISNFDKKILELWKKADYRVFNLECVLGENLVPIKKSGPNLISPTETINGIKSLNPNLILLSNNHILDYGIKGLEHTIECLTNNDIKYTGIINNSKESLECPIIESKNLKIGIYNVCENEFSVATPNNKGANGLNEIKNYKEVKKLKEKCDKVIVIFHGGKEFYRYPSPNLQRICRNFVDFGADFVVTQHSHCIGCVEEYNNRKIVYGQGNFIFDSHSDEYWNTSLLLMLEIDKDNINIKYIPIEKKGNIIKYSTNSDILSDFFARSENIKKNKFIEKEYNNFAKKNINLYLNIVNRVRFHTKILNRLNKRKFFCKIYNQYDCLRILNIIECEAHRELFIQGLKERINNK